uniref:alpha-amylase n=1 Tax=Culicoides sonorensis TaxID=179676 RepID=A0A336MI31_CULSO
MVATCFIVLNFILITVFAQKTPHFYEDRSVLVSLLDWKFNDIANECENFLGPNGYGGVQISPVTENAILEGRPWYERYQPVSYNIITRSGNEKQFKDMVQRCNDAKVRVYVELVLNHMAAGEEIFGTGGSKANGEILMYPAVKFNASDFHKKCQIEDFSNPEQIRNCRIRESPDLNQGQAFVQNSQMEVMNKLIEYGVAGFLISSAEYMEPAHLKEIISKVSNLNENFDFPEGSRPFMMFEVIDYGNGAVSRNEYTELGVVTEYRYTRDVSNAFQTDRTLHSLLGLGPKHGYLPSEDAVVFVHAIDGKRAESHKILDFNNDQLRYQMAMAFMLAYPYGIPTIISSFKFDSPNQGPPADDQGEILSPEFNAEGQCTNGWTCEHRLPIVQHMIKFRKMVGNSSLNNWADNGKNQIAFCRGKDGFIAFHNEPNGSFKTSIPVCLPEGVYYDIFTSNIEDLEGAKLIIVNDSKKAKIEIKSEDGYRMIAFHTGSRVNGATDFKKSSAEINEEIEEELEELEELIKEIEDEYSE